MKLINQTIIIFGGTGSLGKTLDFNIDNANNRHVYHLLTA